MGRHPARTPPGLLDSGLARHREGHTHPGCRGRQRPGPTRAARSRLLPARLRPPRPALSPGRCVRSPRPPATARAPPRPAGPALTCCRRPSPRRPWRVRAGTLGRPGRGSPAGGRPALRPRPLVFRLRARGPSGSSQAGQYQAGRSGTGPGGPAAAPPLGLTPGWAPYPPLPPAHGRPSLPLVCAPRLRLPPLSARRALGGNAAKLLLGDPVAIVLRSWAPARPWASGGGGGGGQGQPLLPGYRDTGEFGEPSGRAQRARRRGG